MATKRTRDYDPNGNPWAENPEDAPKRTAGTSPSVDGSDYTVVWNDDPDLMRQQNSEVYDNYQAERDAKIKDAGNKVKQILGATQNFASKHNLTPGTNNTTTPSAYDTLDNIYSDRFGLTKQEQKRRRRDEMISSIGDAVSALGSLYFTKKDGVPVYDPTKSMTEATRKRYDRILTERRQAFNDYLAAERVRELNDYRKRRLDLDAQKLAETARVNDSKIEANKALYLQRKAAGAAQDELAEIRRYQALLEKYKAEGYPEYLKAQIADYESRVRRNDASAGASAASANLSNTRAANVNAEKTTVTTEGEDGSKISTTTYTPRGSGQNGNTGNNGGKTPLPTPTPKKQKLPRGN